MTSHHATPDHLASAVLDATLIVMEASRSSLQTTVGTLGLALQEDSNRPDHHPVLLEFWNVSDGRMRPFGIENEVWWDLWSTAWGGAAALSLGGLRGASVAD